MKDSCVGRIDLGQPAFEPASKWTWASIDVIHAQEWEEFSKMTPVVRISGNLS
jgi:hypothetical protein